MVSLGFPHDFLAFFRVDFEHSIGLVALALLVVFVRAFGNTIGGKLLVASCLVLITVSTRAAHASLFVLIILSLCTAHTVFLKIIVPVAQAALPPFPAPSDWY